MLGKITKLLHDKDDFGETPSKQTNSASKDNVMSPSPNPNSVSVSQMRGTNTSQMSINAGQSSQGLKNIVHSPAVNSQQSSKGKSGKKDGKGGKGKHQAQNNYN